MANRNHAARGEANDAKRLLRSLTADLNALLRDREATPARIRDAAEAVAQQARRYEEAASRA